MRALRIFGCVLLLAFCVMACGGEESAVLSVYNYPNPCTPAQGTNLVLQYTDTSVTGPCSAYLYVYDLSGAPVMVRYATNISGANGRFTIPWDVTNDRGEALAPGVYIFKAITERLGAGIAAQNASHRLMVGGNP